MKLAMTTGIAYIEVRMRIWDACHEIYGRHLRLTELQNTIAVQPMDHAYMRRSLLS